MCSIRFNIHLVNGLECCSQVFHPYHYELDHLVMPESLTSKPDVQVSVLNILVSFSGTVMTVCNH